MKFVSIFIVFLCIFLFNKEIEGYDKLRKESSVKSGHQVSIQTNYKNITKEAQKTQKEVEALKCPYGCSKCIKDLRNFTQCTKCDTKIVADSNGPNDGDFETKYKMKLYKGRCYEKCPLNSIEIRGICQPCHLTCRTCSKINDENKCTSCSYSLLEIGKCVQVCRDGFAVDQTDKSCKVCHQSCRTCKIPNDNTQCIECRLGFFNLFGTCQEMCPQHYVADKDKNCGLCHPTCAECYQKANKSQCKSCSDFNHVLGIKTKECVGTCGDGQAPNAKKICETCHDDCKTCLVPSDPLKCTSCISYMSLHKNTCVETCPKKTVSVNINELDLEHECQACHPTCLTCTAPNDSQKCDTCHTNLFHYNNSCLSKCPVKYEAQYQNECDWCGENCTSHSLVLLFYLSIFLIYLLI